VSTLIKLLGVGAAVYIVLLGFLYLFQRSLIYHPDTTRPVPSVWGVSDMSVVTLKAADGQSLLAWWKAPQSEDKPTVLFFHGNAGHIGYRSGKVRPLLDRGFGVLLVAWRGYSGNDGSPSEAGLYADGRAALRFLDDKGIAEEKRVFYGESLGSGVAVELASHGHGGALVLEAPYTSLPRVGASHYPVFPVRLLMRDRFDSVTKVGRIFLPMLIFHGDEDRIIPVEFGRSLFAAANEPKQGVFITGAEHNNLYEFGAAKIVLGFVDGLYGGKQ
jgi:fermentation-respiration switch protein FrsA (DUF1100 family)